MIEPKEVSDAFMAFPANVIKEGYLPPEIAIPDDYWRKETKWHKLFNDIFFSGLKSIKVIPKDGIDANMAWRHIGVCMRSFEPKHEHKVAGVTYLMDIWFEDAEWETVEKERI